MSVGINVHSTVATEIEVKASHVADELTKVTWLNIKVNGTDMNVFFPNIQAMKDFVDAQAIAVNKMLMERAGEEV